MSDFFTNRIGDIRAFASNAEKPRQQSYLPRNIRLVVLRRRVPTLFARRGFAPMLDQDRFAHDRLEPRAVPPGPQNNCQTCAPHDLDGFKPSRSGARSERRGMAASCARWHDKKFSGAFGSVWAVSNGKFLVAFHLRGRARSCGPRWARTSASMPAGSLTALSRQGRSGKYSRRGTAIHRINRYRNKRSESGLCGHLTALSRQVANRSCSGRGSGRFATIERKERNKKR
jgi:hypothetical protein